MWENFFCGRTPTHKHLKQYNNNTVSSRKYWRELNLAVEPKIATARILVDLNLAVRYRIAIRIYASRKFWWIFNFGGYNIDRQTAKFNSPPNFWLYGIHVCTCTSIMINLLTPFPRYRPGQPYAVYRHGPSSDH